MRKVILSLTVIAAIGLLSCKKAIKKETTATKVVTISNQSQMTNLSFGVIGESRPYVDVLFWGVAGLGVAIRKRSLNNSPSVFSTSKYSIKK